ncbi:MAG TPA: cell division protein FtsQ/DivIB [Pseudomonadales bacterium]|jgi:cell division protein FtsQ
MSRRGASLKAPARKVLLPVEWRQWTLRAMTVLAVVGAAAVLAVLGWQAVDGVREKTVSAVDVKGDLRYLNPADVQSLLDPVVKDALMSIDLEEIRAALMTNPWIDQVTVRRHWPDRLEITIIEQVPIAYWGDRALLNYRGELFRPGSIPAIAALPVLEGPDDSAEEVMRRYQELDQLFDAEGLNVVRLAMDDRHAWRLWFQPSVEVVLGQGDVAKKLKRLLTVYRAELHEHIDQVERIDLRYGNGLAVGWLSGHSPWEGTGKS